MIVSDSVLGVQNLMGNTLTVCHCQNLSETGFYFNSFPKMIPKAIPAGIYLLKVNYRNTRARCEICSKLTIKTSEWSHCCCSAGSIANFEHISCLVQVFLLLTSNMLLLAGLKQILLSFFFLSLDTVRLLVKLLQNHNLTN